MSAHEARTTQVRVSFDGIAPRYDGHMRLLERHFLGARRAALWRGVAGPEVLEVGVGTGASFAYYPAGAQVVAADLSPGMLAVARERACRDGVSVDLRLMDVQCLDLADASFDDVVSSLVFCSVPDPHQGLREIGRVLKPGGQLHLLEHVRGPKPFGTLMDLLDPLTARVGGEHINRRTAESVGLAGFEILGVRSYAAGVLQLITARLDRQQLVTSRRTIATT